jgi:branched-subunit amino acid ABC-type transport system permease component
VFLQTLFNGVVTGIIITLPALAVTLLFGVLKFPNFAVAGVLIGMDRALEPPVGSNYLVPVFAAAILGGLGSPLGAFVGAIIIGVASELSTLAIPPNYRIGVPLVVIALILMFRPQGLFGQPYIRR